MDDLTRQMDISGGVSGEKGESCEFTYFKTAPVIIKVIYTQIYTEKSHTEATKATGPVRP